MVVLIVGAGQIGQRAFNMLAPKESCVIIDHLTPAWLTSSIQCFPDRFSLIRTSPILDGQKKHGFLLGSMDSVYSLCNEISFTWIIPAVPLHLLAELLKLAFHEYSANLKSSPQIKPLNLFSRPDFRIAIPENLHYRVGSQYELYFSYAAGDEQHPEICPLTCSGPAEFCPNFHRIKPLTVSETVDHIIPKDWIKYHLVSQQIAPGLGGLIGSDVIIALNEFKKILHNQKKTECIGIATSCNCHGVLEGWTLD
jgi:hypothetical protein